MIHAIPHPSRARRRADRPCACGAGRTPWVPAVFAVALASCGWVVDAPEARARDFIESLIARPESAESVARDAEAYDARNGFAVLSSSRRNHPVGPEAGWLGGLSARVAIDYLRAREKQGVKLSFGYGAARRPTESEWVVAVVVTDPQSWGGSAPGAKNEVRFEVTLRREGDAWRVTDVTTDG